jgi:hypothetical protein
MNGESILFNLDVNTGTAPGQLEEITAGFLEVGEAVSTVAATAPELEDLTSGVSQVSATMTESSAETTAWTERINS